MEPEEMATAIAERVAVDEIDLAPELYRAYVERRVPTASAQPGTQLGGFGGLLEGSVLLALFGALTACFNVITSVVEARAKMLAARVDLEEARLRLRNQELSKDASQHNAVQTLAQHLQAGGMKPEQAQQVAVQTLTALLTQPEPASRFLSGLKSR